MTTAVAQVSARRQEIVDWYDSMARRSFWEILGVPRRADAPSVHAAFRALVKRFHPDALGPAEADLRDKAQAVLMQITAAYEALLAGAPLAAVPPPAAEPPQRAVVAPERAEPPVSLPAAAPERPAAATVPSKPRRLRVQEGIEDAQAYLGRSDPDAAVEVLHGVIRLAEDDQRDRIRLLLATAYVADPGKRRYAQGLLSEIVREEPSNAEALFLLGTLYLREGLLARAESTLARAAAADPSHAKAREALRRVRESAHRRGASSEQQGSHRGGLVARLLSMAR